MKFKILSIVLVLMMAFSGVVYADISFDAPLFDYDTLKLKLSGNTTNSYSEGVMLSVMPYDTDRTTMNDDTVSAGSMLFDYVLSGKDGVFTYEITLNSDFLAGKYAVYADTALQTAVTTFVFIDSAEAQPVVELINGASTALGVKSLIADNADKLGVNSTEYEKYDTYISNVIYASKPDGGYSIDEFVTQYYRAYVMAQIKNGVITLDGVVNEYGVLIGIDSEAYNALTDAAKIELEGLVKSEKGYKGDVMNYEYNYILAQIKASAGYEEQGGYIVSNAEFIGIDTAKYESITNRYYKDMILKDVYDDYESLEEIVPVWKRVVDECYDAWKGNKPAAGGSGGGRPDSAMAGTKDVSNISAAMEAVAGIVKGMIK